MDTQLDLTPQVNSNNFNRIINILSEFPPTQDKDKSIFEEILSRKTAWELNALYQCLDYFFYRDSLNITLLEFLLKLTNAEELLRFIPWFDKITLRKNQLLEISSLLIETKDLKKIIDRLNQLEQDQIIHQVDDYDFFYALILLIQNELDIVPYIQALEDCEHPYLLLRSYIYLKKSNLLREPYDQFLSDEASIEVSPWIKALLLVRLDKHKLLTDKNFRLCSTHHNLIMLENLTGLLAETPHFLENYFDLISHQNVSLIEMYMHYLKNNALLSKEFIEILHKLNGVKLKNFVRILLISDRHATISPSLIIKLSDLNTRRLKKIVHALNLLVQENYLNQETLNYIFTYSFYPDLVIEFTQSLVILKANELPNEWIEIIHSSSQPLPTTFCIIELYKSGILTREIYSKISHVRSINFFYKLLKDLNLFKMLNEVNLDNLVRLDNLIDEEKYKSLINKKNVSALFYEDIFNILLNKDLGAEEKTKKIGELIVDDSYVKRVNVLINPAESTHVASIQTSFSQVINKFVLNYWGKIDDFDKIYNEISEELNIHLSDNPFKYLAARRALNNLISDTTFVDSESKLNLKQFLILLWVGILDRTQREGSLIDAKRQLFEGLYESQRGGNINAHGQDNTLPDEPICCKGVMHKLLEKLIGIHNYLEFVFITPELASLKFPIIVEEEAKNYLQSLDPEIIFLNYERFIEGGVPSIWPHIESSIRTRMLEEFGSLYVNIDSAGESVIHKDFEELMANHVYLTLDSNFITSFKAAFVERKFEAALYVENDCVGSVSASRPKRSVGKCVEQIKKNSQRYQPLDLENNNLKGILVFFTGILSNEQRDFLIYKIHKFKKDTNLNSNQIESLWKKTQNELATTHTHNADLIELENQKGEKHYLSIKRILMNDERLNSIYCPDVNYNQFLNFKAEYDIETCIELYSQLLFPDEYAFRIRQRNYRYIFSKPHVLKRLDEHLTGDLAWFSAYYHLDSFHSPLIEKKLWHFFSINGNAINHNQEVSLATISGVTQPISFNLCKISEVFLLKPEQQIVIANLLNTYPILIDKDYSSYNNEYNSKHLSLFRNKLVQELKNFGKKSLTVSESTLVHLAQEYLHQELSEQGLKKQEIDSLFENHLKNFNNARLSLKKIIPVMRQIPLQIPAFLQALNGQTDNLQFMIGLTGSDMTWNQVFHTLINHENFVSTFPKSATILAKLEPLTSSPVVKFLIINSFFELTDTLSRTSVTSPEHQLAKNLLVDNSIIFSLMFVESLGLELGPAGLIFDLGITIHQLISSAEYLRQRYHLHISSWEAIKFNLGFSSEINGIFQGRELLNMNLQFVDQWSSNIRTHFKYLILKIPKLEKKLVRISENEFPTALLNQTKKSSWKSIENLYYTYSAVRWRELMSVRLLQMYYRNQYQVIHASKPFSVIFESSKSQCHEDNIFPSPLKKCHYKLEKECIPLTNQNYINCLKTKLCRSIPSSVLNWKILISSQRDCTNTEVTKPLRNRFITIQNEIGGLLYNSQKYNNKENQLDLLVLFQPEFGDMEFTDGIFLNNKNILVLIHDSMLANHVVRSSSYNQSSSKFIFHTRNYVNNIYYQLSHTELKSYIIDYSDKLYIYSLPLMADQLPDHVTMINNSEIVFGKKGPHFFELNTKREIKINFNLAYFLVGEFTFNSQLINLEKPVNYFPEEAIFNLALNQFFILHQPVGQYRFLIENTNFDLTINIRKFYDDINIKKMNDFFYVFTAIDLKLMQLIRYNDFASKHSFFAIYLRQDNDRILTISGSLANTPMKFILEGNYSVNTQAYHIQFSIEEKSQVCIFYKFLVEDFFDNIELIKKMITNGFTNFQFYLEYTIEQVNYTDDFYLKYKEINYYFDPEYQLVAISGAKLANVTNAETFSDLLIKIPIDLRNFQEIKKLNATYLRVAKRHLFDISPQVRLITPHGTLHMGVLPIAIEPIARAQKQGFSVESPSYLNPLSKQSAFSSSSHLSKYGNLIHLIFSASFFSIFRNDALRLQNFGLLVTGNLVLTYFKSVAAIFPTWSGSQHSIPNEKYATYSKQTPNPYNNSVANFFQTLPNQLILIYYFYGLFKKNNHNQDIETSIYINKTLFAIGNVIMKYEKSLTRGEQFLAKKLIKQLIRFNFLVPCTKSILNIKSKSQYDILVDLITSLESFKNGVLKSHTKKQALIRLKKLLRRLDKCLMMVDIHSLQSVISPIGSQINLFMQGLNEQIHLARTLTPTQQRWLINRINLISDSLDYFQQNEKKSFAEIAHFINVLLPEAKRVVLFFTDNKNFIFNRYLNLKKFISFFVNNSVNQNDFNHYHIAQNETFFKNSFLTCNDIGSHDTRPVNSSKWEWLSQSRL